MVSPPLLDGFLLLWVCMSSCLLLRADIYLLHPPVFRGGLGPRRWLIGSILLGCFLDGPFPSSYLESEEFSHLAEAASWKTKPRTQILPRRNLLSNITKITFMGTDSGCPTFAHSRCKPSCTLFTASEVTEPPCLVLIPDTFSPTELGVNLDMLITSYVNWARWWLFSEPQFLHL